LPGRRRDAKNPRVPFRFLCAAFLVTALGAAGALAAEPLAIVRVQTGWRPAESFKRISEYFDGQENTSGQVVARTHPESRAGFYFLVRVANAGAPFEARVALEVIPSADVAPLKRAFPVALPAGQAVLNLGLTGSDWSETKPHPVAWKLEILDGEGRVLAAEKSYLWDQQPAAK
jgi:hypothetical protein